MIRFPPITSLRRLALSPDGQIIARFHGVLIECEEWRIAGFWGCLQGARPRSRGRSCSSDASLFLEDFIFRGLILNTTFPCSTCQRLLIFGFSTTSMNWRDHPANWGFVGYIAQLEAQISSSPNQQIRQPNWTSDSFRASHRLTGRSHAARTNPISRTG